MAIPSKRNTTRTASGPAKTGALPTKTKGQPVSGAKRQGSKPAPASADTVARHKIPESNRKQGNPVGADRDRTKLGSPDTSVHGGTVQHRQSKAQHGLTGVGTSHETPEGRRSRAESPTGASHHAANTQAHARPGQGTKGVNTKPKPYSNVPQPDTTDPAAAVQRAGSRPRNRNAAVSD